MCEISIKINKSNNLIPNVERTFLSRRGKHAQRSRKNFRLLRQSFFHTILPFSPTKTQICIGNNLLINTDI